MEFLSKNVQQYSWVDWAMYQLFWRKREIYGKVTFAVADKLHWWSVPNFPMETDLIVS